MTNDDWLCLVTHTHHKSKHKPPAAPRTLLILTAADRLIKHASFQHENNIVQDIHNIYTG